MREVEAMNKQGRVRAKGYHAARRLRHVPLKCEGGGGASESSALSFAMLTLQLLDN